MFMIGDKGERRMSRRSVLLCDLVGNKFQKILEYSESNMDFFFCY